MSNLNDLDKFTTNFLEEYERIDPEKYNSETKLREIETWDYSEKIPSSSEISS